MLMNLCSVSGEPSNAMFSSKRWRKLAALVRRACGDRNLESGIGNMDEDEGEVCGVHCFKGSLVMWYR